MNIYEMYGRQAEELNNAIEAHFKTLTLLRDIKEGKQSIDEVEILPNGWEIKND